jgi:hypothetical protein
MVVAANIDIPQIYSSMIYAGDTLIQELNESTSEVKFNGALTECKDL